MNRLAAWLLAVTIALGLGGASAVWARGVASELTACVEPRTGYLVFGRECGGQRVTWNSEGLSGPQGLPGAQGPPGPPGAPGKGFEPQPPSEAQVTAQVAPPKALFAPPKAKIAANLVGKSKAGGTGAWSVFHDQAVAVPNILAAAIDKNAPWGIVAAHLDVPADSYVVVAKAEVFLQNPKGSWLPGDGGVRCALVAGADFDNAAGTVWSTLALTVVHAFPKAGRIELRCTAWSVVGLSVEHIKLTAIRVSALKNAYLAAWPPLFG